MTQVKQGIEFITGGKQQPGLVFGNVEVDQFFVNDTGCLCQKYNDSRVHIIALPDGEPESGYYESSWNEPVQKILPRVKKITFPGMEG